MCFAYVLPDTTPQLGIAKNGKQVISVYDKTGVRATYVSSTENVDKFLKERNAVSKTVIFGALTTCTAAFGGLLFALESKVSKNTKVGALAALGVATLLSWLPCFSASKKCDKALNDIKNDSNTNVQSQSEK